MRLIIVFLLACASLAQAFNESDWSLVETRLSSQNLIVIQPTTNYYWLAIKYGADVVSPSKGLVDQPKIDQSGEGINDIVFDSDRVLSVTKAGLSVFDLSTEGLEEYPFDLGKNAWNLEIVASTAYVGGANKSISFSVSDPSDQTIFFDGYNTARGMVTGQDGKVWVILSDTALGYIRDGEEYIVDNSDLPGLTEFPQFSSLTADRDGNIFVSSGVNIITNKGGDWTLVYRGEDLDGFLDDINIGSELTIDRDGNIWSLGGKTNMPALLRFNVTTEELEIYPIEDISWITQLGGTQLALDNQGRLIIAANKVVATYQSYESVAIIRLPKKDFVDNQPAKFYNLKGQIIRDNNLRNFTINIEKFQR